MKNITLFILCLFLSTASLLATEYDVVRIYKRQDLPRDAKAIDQYNSIREVKVLFIPTEELKKGDYQVTLTRLENGYYQIDKTDYVVELRYCYEYANHQTAVLKVESPYGYSQGKVIFTTDQRNLH